MELNDDDLKNFASHGAKALPLAGQEGHVAIEGARIWFASYGVGPAIVMLHGGLGHSGNWGYQIEALTARGYRVILIDSRGHGRSTRDQSAYRYERMADDVIAVLAQLEIPRAAFIGWSDGAVIALTVAMRAPAAVAGVFFFGCNTDKSGVKEISMELPTLQRCFARHSVDYAALSATPTEFAGFVGAVTAMMETQPNYSSDDLGRITVPVWVVHAENDEFIKAEHAHYLSLTISGAHLLELVGVSHFAPLQRPSLFNAALFDFLDAVYPRLSPKAS